MRMEEGLTRAMLPRSDRLRCLAKSADQLYSELAVLGGNALVKVLDLLEDGEPVSWHQQPDSGVTYAEKIEKGELDISPSLSAGDAWRRGALV